MAKLSIFGTLEVSRDLSGGVRVKCMNASCVLAPADAIRFFTAGLRAAGVEVQLIDQVRPPVALGRRS